MSSKDLVWMGPAGTKIPSNCSEPEELITYANGLNKVHVANIAKAFVNEAYDMGAEFAWRKSMIKLKSTLKTLGMSFVGEMLNDQDIDEFSNINVVLNDYNAINLAEQLGAINSTGALKLRQSLEILSHYLSEDAEKNGEVLSKIDAASVISSCVKYILGETDISIAIKFSELRDRLFTESLTIDDPQIEQLIESPPFYIKTVVAVLLSGIRSEKGATLEHAIGNLSSMIESIWKKIPEKDKWQIGEAYRDAIAAGNVIAAKGLKNVLLKVKGFDFVPENLRSTAFRKAAKSVTNAHFAMNNFYTEGPLVANLSKLGSLIPSPAFIDCIQAYLCVYLGNRYGVCNVAHSTATSELHKIQDDRWEYYFEKVFVTDEKILMKLTDGLPRANFKILFQNRLSFLLESEKLNTNVYKLLQASNEGNDNKISVISNLLQGKIRQ